MHTELDHKDSVSWDISCSPPNSASVPFFLELIFFEAQSICRERSRDVFKKCYASRVYPSLDTSMCSKGDSWFWVHRSTLMIQLIKQPLGLHSSTWGDWAEEKKAATLSSNNTTHSTNSSDFSQVLSYTVMKLILQHKLMNTKNCRFLLSDFAQAILKQHDSSKCSERGKTNKSYHSKAPHGCILMSAFHFLRCLTSLLLLKCRNYRFS